MRASAQELPLLIFHFQSFQHLLKLRATTDLSGPVQGAREGRRERERGEKEETCSKQRAENSSEGGTDENTVFIGVANHSCVSFRKQFFIL